MKDEAYRALAILGMFSPFVGGIKAQPLSSVGVGKRKEGMTPLQPSVLQGLGTTLGTVEQREGQGRLFKLHSCFASSVIQWENGQPPGNEYLDLPSSE